MAFDVLADGRVDAATIMADCSNDLFVAPRRRPSRSGATAGREDSAGAISAADEGALRSGQGLYRFVRVSAGRALKVVAAARLKSAIASFVADQRRVR
jgi:hypothetical protein